jgi:hypothetical protein
VFYNSLKILSEISGNDALEDEIYEQKIVGPTYETLP